MERRLSLHSINDEELLRRLAELLRQSRRNEADLVAHIGEVDERRLYAREASPSMFAYCMEVLHLSEAEAYLRITAARASREHPVLLDMLEDGRLHLTGIAKLAPHLSRENAGALLRRATHRSKRQILELVAEIAPRPDAPCAIRRLPERRPPAAPALAAAPQEAAIAPPGVASSSALGPVQALAPDQTLAPVQGSGPRLTEQGATGLELRPDRAHSHRPASAMPAVVEPLAPGRYKVQFTAGARLHEKLVRLQGLMRARVPDGDLATIIEAAVTEKLERLEAKRFALTNRPRKALRQTSTAPTSRHVPAAVKRAAHERAGGGCAYVDERGRRCSERIRLEFHHRYPYGRGGDHSPRNVALLCAAHNLLQAEHDYGRGVMARFRGPGGTHRDARRPPPPESIRT